MLGALISFMVFRTSALKLGSRKEVVRTVSVNAGVLSLDRKLLLLDLERSALHVKRLCFDLE